MIVTRYADRVQASSFVELGNPDAPARSAQMAAAGGACRGARPADRGAVHALDGRAADPAGLSARDRPLDARTQLLYAFGHQHLGLTLAPIDRRASSPRCVAGKEPRDADLPPFDIDRFGRPPMTIGGSTDRGRTGDASPPWPRPGAARSAPAERAAAARAARRADAAASGRRRAAGRRRARACAISPACRWNADRAAGGDAAAARGRAGR